MPEVNDFNNIQVVTDGPFLANQKTPWWLWSGDDGSDGDSYFFLVHNSLGQKRQKNNMWVSGFFL
jgi:hypothetical protein